MKTDNCPSLYQDSHSGKDGFRIEKVIYEPMQGLYVTAALYRSLAGVTAGDVSRIVNSLKDRSYVGPLRLGSTIL